jgi:D-glycero-D-manno-heptose 1,7-bisphosphate phosphatase
MKKVKVAFLDRDGVINLDKGYVGFVSQFIWVKGAKRTIKYLKKKNYKVIIVSNQSGVARGFFKYNDVIKLHRYVQKELANFGTKIDKFYFSPYHKDGIVKKYKIDHPTRKPKIGMFIIANSKYFIDKKNSFMIGDKITDIIFARKIGVKGFLFKDRNLYNFIKKKNI